MPTSDKDSALLGGSFHAASRKLKKLLLFRCLETLDMLVCFRCGVRITLAEELSVDHKIPWRSADDPVAVFFDLGNIAFSHLNCNSRAASKWHIGDTNRAKTHCPAGHEYTVENTRWSQNQRYCCECGRKASREWKRRMRSRQKPL